jgi:hypothetical protein
MNFRIKPADTFIWNYDDLVNFLIANQGQQIIIENGTEGCCARTIGLYQLLDQFQFESVTIKTSNPLEQHDRYHIEIFLPWKFLSSAQPVDKQWHIWNKNQLFGAVYGRPLWHRLGLAAHLIANHSDKSSVGLTANAEDQDQRKLFELTELWQHSPGSLKQFANIADRLPLYHNDVETYTPGLHLTNGYVAQTQRVYQNFLIDVVAETFTAGNCFFVTEKTVRPMLLKKPFIVMGSMNYLDYLHQMGFRTFSDFWDEHYDGYSGTERYHRIINLIDNLAQKKLDELETMYLDMQYTLDHNYDLLLTQCYKKGIKQL